MYSPLEGYGGRSRGEAVVKSRDYSHNRQTFNKSEALREGMPLATKIAGFAAFGVLVRAYALGIQRRNPFERMLLLGLTYRWRSCLTCVTLFCHFKAQSLTLAAPHSLGLWVMPCTGQNRGKGTSSKRNIVRLLKGERCYELRRPRQSQNRVFA